MSLLSLDPKNLDNINAEKSVEIFRELLWCHSRKYNFPISKIHISSRVNVSDGGVDTRIEDAKNEIKSELFIAPGSSFQIKTGSSFKPWQESQVKNELFGSGNKVGLKNLAVEIRRCLDEGKRYGLVCFGIDPVPQQINDSITLLKKLFRACGYEDPKIDVWGQTHLIGMISEFPSLVLKVLGKSDFQHQTLFDWSKNDDMKPALVLGKEQNDFINNLRRTLRNSDNHIRIIGEPGIGKTRLVLEALSEQDLAPLVIYTSNPSDFQKSSFFNDIIRSDSPHHLIIVIDDCAEKERASIWNVLKHHRSRCKLITIDHGPEWSSDDAMQVFKCPLLPEEQVTEIIYSYINHKNESNRWAKECDGSPRVAHAIGLNLQKNPDDIFRPPATVPLWERFIAGYGNLQSEINQQKLVILRHLSLFYRFGYEPPVSEEGQFVASIVNKNYPSITYVRFQEVIEQLREKRILQGKHTLFIVPKALHIYLWLDFWKYYGTGFNINAFFKDLPDGLLNWFTRMFIYAHANRNAQYVVNDILKEDGLFNDEDFLVSEVGTNFLSVLAEADHKSTLKCIERTFGSWTKEKLKEWETGRQNIVWALEKIAIWPETFNTATNLLLKLGVAENSNYSNNASGTFVNMFSLAYGAAAPTVTPPKERIGLLEKILKSSEFDERALGLKACEVALSPHIGFRIIGAEYQGIRPAAKLWTPKTYGELFDAYHAIWNLLFSTSREWDDSFRIKANSILINAAQELIQIRELEKEILETIEKLIEDPAIEIINIVNFIIRIRRYQKENVSSFVIERINQFDLKISGITLEEQINRYVFNSSWSEDRDSDTTESPILENKIKELAERSLNESHNFLKILKKLICQTGHKSYEFAFEIGKRDQQKTLLPEILSIQKYVGKSGNPLFFSGYLRSIKESSEEEWQKIVSNILFDKDLKFVAGQIPLRTGINDFVLKNMLKAYKENIILPRDFLILGYPTETKHINPDLVEETLSILLDSKNEDAYFVALEIASSFFLKSKESINLPRDLTYKLLKNPIAFKDKSGTMEDFYWSELAKAFISIYSEDSLELFGTILSKTEDWHFITLKSYDKFHEILSLIAKSNPVKTWKIVESYLVDLNSALANGVIHWLQAERGIFDEGIYPLTYFHLEDVFTWISKDPAERAPALTWAMPKTFDVEKGGEYTRQLLVRFGSFPKIISGLFSNFFTDGWSGPASIHYRKKRDVARNWLSGETSEHVISWLEEYIDRLSSRIEAEEIREEREF